MNIRFVVASTLLLLVAGCGGDDGTQGRGGSSSRCSSGEQKACTCPDGSGALRQCGADGAWDDCPCDTTPGADTVGADDVTTGDDGVGGPDLPGGEESPCQRQCNGRQCGPDSCGGTCGTCPDGLTCGPTYQCQDGPCQPACAGRECGDDGCGGSCGSCSAGTCDASGQCVTSCTPSCSGKACGDNGCGGSCGSCGSGSSCNASGQCVGSCTPQCSGKVCGSDGCGGSCGSCASGSSCQSGQCVSTTQLTCQQLYLDCFPDCGTDDTACAQACYEQLSTTGKTEADAFMNCLQTNACYDAADFNDCMTSKCFGEYLGCFHGEKSCAQVASCMNGCSSSDTTCWADCLAEGTTDVQIEYYNRMDTCLVAACCPSDTATCNTTEGQTCLTTALSAGGQCTWPSIGCP